METSTVGILTETDQEQLLQPDMNILHVTPVEKPSLIYDISKRLFDIIVSSLCIIGLCLVLLAVAIYIKVREGGSILHLREIVGYRGQRFYALKFRTMIPDADDYLVRHTALMKAYQQNMKLENDPRITSTGRFLRRTSLDELPQLFNVLVGQMSLVGPRIIHPSELHRYGKYAQKRLSVRPGLTGLWQISGRQHVSYEERIQLDMQYIDTRSFVGDVVIFLKTVKVVIERSGA